jgi:hypothetical protein
VARYRSYTKNRLRRRAVNSRASPSSATNPMADEADGKLPPPVPES